MTVLVLGITWHTVTLTALVFAVVAAFLTLSAVMYVALGGAVEEMTKDLGTTSKRVEYPDRSGWL